MITRTLARINQVEERLNSKADKLPAVYCVYEDGHDAVLDVVTAIISCMGKDNAEPGEKIIHVEPTGDTENKNLYDTLKQLADERKYTVDQTGIKCLERDGRTDPPFK